MSKQIDLYDIKISDEFQKVIPRPHKVTERLREYKHTGKFSNEIVINNDDVLIDGYTQYLVCKMLDLVDVNAIVLN